MMAAIIATALLAAGAALAAPRRPYLPPPLCDRCLRFATHECDVCEGLYCARCWHVGLCAVSGAAHEGHKVQP